MIIENTMNLVKSHKIVISIPFVFSVIITLELTEIFVSFPLKRIGILSFFLSKKSNLLKSDFLPLQLSKNFC